MPPAILLSPRDFSFSPLSFALGSMPRRIQSALFFRRFWRSLVSIPPSASRNLFAELGCVPPMPRAASCICFSSRPSASAVCWRSSPSLDCSWLWLNRPPCCRAKTSGASVLLRPAPLFANGPLRGPWRPSVARPLVAACHSGGWKLPGGARRRGEQRRHLVGSGKLRGPYLLAPGAGDRERLACGCRLMPDRSDFHSRLAGHLHRTGHFAIAHFVGRSVGRS